MVRWIWDNIGTLLLSFILAIAAWVAAIDSADPIETQTLPGSISIEYASLPEGLTLSDDLPSSAEITLRAPASVLRQLSEADIHLTVDLSGLTPGKYRIAIGAEVDRSPVQVVSVSPASVTLTLEKRDTKTVPIEIRLNGDPVLGFRADKPSSTPDSIVVSGPASAVARVVAARAELSLVGQRSTLDEIAPLVPVDEEGREVTSVELEQPTAQVIVPIVETEQFRPVSVVANVTGVDELQAEGYYRVASISVTPSVVSVYSSNPEALDALPGFVKTVPLDISGETDDVERKLLLDLPQGVSLVGDQTVTVRVDIEPLQTSITITRPVEIQGAGPSLYGHPSPTEVSVILSGPAITLDSLKDEDVRVIVNILDLGVGTYQIEPQVIVLPPGIEWEAPNPSTIEVEVSTTPPPTATPAP